MIIDCATCPVRGQRCDDCAVTVLHISTVTSGPGLLSDPDQRVADQRDADQRDADLQLDAAERRVVSMFVGAGMVKRGPAAKLRARRESVQEWDPVWDAG